MPILREDDARIGCLALPISAVAGFVLFALGAAAFGLGAASSSIAGLAGMAVGAVLAAVIVHRT